MDVRTLHAVVDALLAIPTSDPAQVARALGAPLSLVESKFGHERYTATFAGGPFATAEHSNRVGFGDGQLTLTPSRNTLAPWDLGLERYGPPSISHSTTGFDGHMSHWFAFDDRRRELCFGFRGGALFDTLIVRWGPPKYTPGDEPVFATAPPVIQLASYDIAGDAVEYVPAARAWRAPTTATTATFGAFTREGPRIAAVFATPAGPAIAVDGKRVLAIRGDTTAKVERAGPRLRFLVFHKSNALAELLYQERHGIGSNPYDREPADVDLLALIAAGLRRDEFFQAYTRPWLAG